jgi:diguanylate cyclase (GGDEF)-like protein
MKQSEILELLIETTEAINSQTYLQQGLRAIIDMARKIFGCRTIAVILTDPESEYLKVKTSRGLSKTFVDNYARPVGTGVIGDTIWAGKPILMEYAQPSDAAYDELKLEHDFGSAICAPIAAQFRPLGYLYCDSERPGAFDSASLTFLKLLANLAALAVDKDRLYTINKKLCRVDERTLILQFEAFHAELEKELRRELRYHEPLSLLLLDINNFKRWKNLYGTESARKLFEDVVYVVRSCVRGMDIIGRYGVDEVIICCPRADEEGAWHLAERICEFIKEYKFEHDEPATSVSIGVVTISAERRDPKSLLEAVGNALLKAQRTEGQDIAAV